MDNEVNNSGNPNGNVRIRRPVLLIGGVLWVVCLVAILLCALQSQPRVTGETSTVSDADDDGRNPRQIKLVPQKDGSLSVTEVTAENAETPWSADGIDDFSFTDTAGQTVTKKDLLGKPFLIAFIFTQCRGPCPNVTKQMREIQDRLKDLDFNLVSLTVDPDRDSQEVLQKYAADSGADAQRWMFLTGDKSEIYGLIQRSFLMPVEEATGSARQPGMEVLHSTNILMVNANGVVIAKYNAMKDDEMVKLRRDLKKLVQPDLSGKSTAEEKPERALPGWAAALPTVNAGLNGLAGIMLIIGLVLIKRNLRTAHAWTMISAFLTSIVFLGCYLVYHYALHEYTGEAGKRFGHRGTLLGATYLLILATHVILAAIVPVLASMTLYRAWRQDWIRHRRIARITFPIWVYVSVTGVMIYVMLYHWPGASP